MLNKFFGSKDFYARVMRLMLPIMIQNGITNLVNMLDNIMVGQVGTVQMNGVSITNQLLFVFNLCIFGAVSGVGIFGAQFYGKGDHKGLRDTFRFKMIFCLALTVVCIGIFIVFGNDLIGLYLTGDGAAGDVKASLYYARQYMNIMLIGLIPCTIAQCYSSTLREMGQTFIPMVAGVSAVVVNISLNYALIFGAFGMPKLGASGAAIATVVSRFVEMFVVAGWVTFNKAKNQFIIGAFKSFRVPKSLCIGIVAKGLPLMINETLWAAGIATVNQCYSVRGLNVVSAVTISQTFFNVFSVAFFAVGVSIGIILGQQLGAGDTETVKDTARKLTAFSVIISFGIGAVFWIAAEYIPLAYNINDDIRTLATAFMQILAITMPFEAYINAAYFTLRSGGKTIITFLFDSCFMWTVAVGAAFILSNYTTLSIVSVYLICQLLNFIKCAVGYIFVNRGIWIKNIVS